MCPTAPIGFRFLVHTRHSLDQSRQGQELSPCIADPRLGKRVPPRTERCSPVCWSLPLCHAYNGDFVLCLQKSFVTFRCVRGLIHTRSCVPLRQWSTRRKTVQPSNTSFDLLLLVAQFSCHHHWDHVAWNLFLATLCFTHFVPSTLISVFTVTAQKLTKFELLCTALMRPASKNLHLRRHSTLMAILSRTHFQLHPPPEPLKDKRSLQHRNSANLKGDPHQN